jgi:hypothetical protein
VLLPDGRVLSAGGGQPFGDPETSDHLTAEIFSPPYLFKGSRPTILSAPTTVHYGARFFVHAPEAASIEEVTWIRLPSMTHAFDMNQRFGRLDFTPEGDGLLVNAPDSPTKFPPGHYMLFILNGLGVPSEAAIVQILPDPTKPPKAPRGLLTRWNPASAVALSWDDADWLEDGFQIERTNGSGWRPLATTLPDDNELSDTTAVPGVVYRYRVRAYNAAGVSSWSDPTVGMIPR